MNSRKYHVSMSPHVHEGTTVSAMMTHIILALVPAAFVGVYYFGFFALKVMVISIVVAVACEAGMQRIMGRKIAIANGHAFLIGLLLALMLPPGLPWWAVAAAAFVAIVLGKQIYGGLGNNPFQPAVVGWVVVRLSYPDYMDLYMQPATGGSSFVTAFEKAVLPLEAVRADLSEVLSYPGWDLFIGLKPGGIGEVCILALLVGGLYLLAKRVITWHAPVGCLVGATVFGLICSWLDPEVYAGPSFHLLNGGLVLAAFFLATDKGTTPVTERGMIICGLMIGMLTILIRYWGAYADGVYFAVLLTNAVTPILDRLRPYVYGRVKEVA